MAERLIRAFIAESDLDMILRLNGSLPGWDAKMMACSDSPAHTRAFISSGLLSPHTTDVAFVDHQLRANSHRMAETGGKDVLDLLRGQGFLRTDTQQDLAAGVQDPDPEGIVIVGMGTDLEQASELGTHSCNLSGPLILDFAERPLLLGQIIEEVRHLKPAIIE